MRTLHVTPALPNTSAARLTELRFKVLDVLPATDFAPGRDANGHNTLMLRLANGIELTAAGDPDLPWLLFEIIRNVEPGDTAQHPFEGCSTPSCAFTDKLSGQAAVDLIVQYAALPAAAPSHLTGGTPA